jgi:hypothetical protein
VTDLDTVATPETGLGQMGRLDTFLRQFDDWRERHRDLGLTAILVLQCAIIFVMAPLAASGLLSRTVVQLVRISTATTAILIVNRKHSFGLFVVLTFLTSLLCTYYVRTGVASEATYLFNIVVTIVFDVSVAWIIARAVFGPGRISVHRIMGAVILYLYLGVIFAALYHLIDTVFYGGFVAIAKSSTSKVSEYMYFSLGALTTAGSGAIVPVHPFARSLALLESVIGQLYPATFIARLMTLHGSLIEPRKTK